MYFGEEDQPLDGKINPVLWVFLMGSAAVMLVGVVNLFGIESPGLTAALAIGDHVAALLARR